MCAVTWGEGVLEGQLCSERHPSGAALRMTVGAGTHPGGVGALLGPSSPRSLGALLSGCLGYFSQCPGTPSKSPWLPQPFIPSRPLETLFSLRAGGGECAAGWSTQVREWLWPYSHCLDGRSLAVALSLPFLLSFPLELETMGWAQGQGISNLSEAGREKDGVLYPT